MYKPKYLEIIEYSLVIFFEKISNLLHTKLTFKLAKFMGFCTYLLSKTLRETAYKNLLHSYFPEKSKEEIKYITRQSFYNLGILLFEIFLFNKWYPRHLQQQINYSENSLEILKTLLDKKKGLILISAHYGNWEYMAFSIANNGYPMNIVYRPLDNKRLDQYINTRRNRYPVHLIQRNDFYKKGLYALRNGEILAVLMDQNQLKGGIFVSFFGRPASTAKGAAILSYKTKSPVVIAHIQRNKDFSHTIHIQPIFTEEIKSPRQYIFQNTQLFTKHIEDIIKKDPRQWFWFHPRWKTQSTRL